MMPETIKETIHLLGHSLISVGAFYFGKWIARRDALKKELEGR